MAVVGHDQLDRPVVSKPTGLEELDVEEILRHRYLGVFGEEPKRHFLGGSDDITFGNDKGGVGKCWRRLAAREEPKNVRQWQDAYREIGRIGSCLGLPLYVQEEITRIYANARGMGLTQRTRLEKQLAKITWLACLIQHYPQPKADINNGLKELYGHGIGKIPNEFVKAANTKLVKFRTKTEKSGHEYLRRYELRNGQMFNEKVLARI